MHTYFFEVEIESLPGNAQGEDVDGAMALVFLRAETMEHAEQGVFAIISAYGWAPRALRSKRKMLPQQLPYLDTETRSAYLRAQEKGAALLFCGWSKPGKQPADGPVPLIKPPRNLLQ